jgi:hypothetical protein
MAPIARDSDELAFILAEYALEQAGKKGWVRSADLFYKRRPAPEARMKLVDVPLLDDAVRGMLMEQLKKQIVWTGQSDAGVTIL